MYARRHTIHAKLSMTDIKVRKNQHFVFFPRYIDTFCIEIACLHHCSSVQSKILHKSCFKVSYYNIYHLGKKSFVSKNKRSHTNVFIVVVRVRDRKNYTKKNLGVTRYAQTSHSKSLSERAGEGASRQPV